MLVNNIDEDTIGFLVEKENEETGTIVKEYEPAIMWNLVVKRLVRGGINNSCTFSSFLATFLLLQSLVPTEPIDAKSRLLVGLTSWLISRPRSSKIVLENAMKPSLTRPLEE